MALLDMNPGKLEAAITSGKLTITVIGGGRIGLSTAVLFANAGAKVTVCDTDSKVVDGVNTCQNHIDEPGLDALFEKVVRSGNLKASNDTAREVSQADVAILCVPTPVTEDKVPVYDHILASAQDVARGLRRGALVIVESTIAPGTLEKKIIPTIERISGMKAGTDFLAASCPERADPGSVVTRFREVPRVIGGVDQHSTAIAEALYRAIADRIVTVSNPMTANAVKLTENVFRDVNIALMSELAVLYERLGIDIYEVIEAASSKPTFLPHYPGAGVGGPCLPANAYYLIVEGNEVGYVPYLVRMAREINDRMPLEVVRHTMDALNKAKKSVKTARVAILGITYKPGVKDTRNSPAGMIVRGLRERGARLAVCDPLVANTEFEGERVTATVEEAVRGADCVVLVTAHDSFKRLDLTRVAKLAAKPFVLVDGRGAFRAVRKPNGTLYAGIGIPLQSQD